MTRTIRLALTALLACAPQTDRHPADTTTTVLVPPDAVQRARQDSLVSLRRDSLAFARLDSAARAIPGYVVDSARTMAEELDRFRAGLTEVSAFSGGTVSRDALIDAWVAAVNARDEPGLGRLTISRAEYAWLVYPHSSYARPPYSQPAALAWRLASKQSDVGRRRLLERFETESLGFASYACPTSPTREGPNALWIGCTVSRRPPGSLAPVSQRLFGAIIERDGGFKFLSLGNDF